MTFLNSSLSTETGHSNFRGRAQNSEFFLYFIILKVGYSQQRGPIAAGPYYVTRPVNFPCGRRPKYPEETHAFRQSVDYPHNMAASSWVEKLFPENRTRVIVPCSNINLNPSPNPNPNPNQHFICHVLTLIDWRLISRTENTELLPEPATFKA